MFGIDSHEAILAKAKPDLPFGEALIDALARQPRAIVWIAERV